MKMEKELQELLDRLKEMSHELRQIMIAQATLNQSLANLTAAVEAATTALAATNPTTSTPDSIVAAYQAGVDSQTVALATATPPVVTPPTPAP